MKKLLLILIAITTLVNAGDLKDVEFDKDNFNLMCIDPLLSSTNGKKVPYSINKGYQRQLTLLHSKVQKLSDITLKHYMGKNSKKDKKASEEMVALLSAVNDYYERNDKETTKEKTKSSSKSTDGFSDDEDFDFSESEVSELTKKGDSTEDKYKSLFDSTMLIIPSNEIYGIGMTDDNRWQIPYGTGEDKENITPNVVFGEYFNPSKRGRRYFLSINIFIFILDSDGDSRVMVQEIDDFNWKRNHRFITAQSGKIIQDTIAKMTGIDIK